MDIENNDSFGFRLSAERLRFNLSQDAVAQIIQSDKQTVYRYEKDKRMMRIDQLQLLLEAGFDIDYLLSGRRSENVHVLSQKEKTWLNLLNAVDVKQHAVLQALVENFAQTYPHNPNE